MSDVVAAPQPSISPSTEYVVSSNTSSTVYIQTVAGISRRELDPKLILRIGYAGTENFIKYRRQ